MGKGINMSDFKVIETQEEFDARISERLKRATETASKKYEGWMSPEELESVKSDYEQKIKTLEESVASAEQKLADKDTEIAESAKYKTDLEKTRIALNAGLKIEYADRLRGETAEEWKADAEALAKDFASSHITAPIGSNEPEITKEVSTRDKFAEWAKSINEQGGSQ